MEILQGYQLNFNKALLNTHFITSHLRLSLIIHAFVSVFRLKEDHCIQCTPNQDCIYICKVRPLYNYTFLYAIKQCDGYNKISYN